MASIPAEQQGSGYQPAKWSNVGDTERAVSFAAGAALAIAGMARMRLSSLAMLGFGAAFAFRGLTGQCQVYKTLGINTNGHRDARQSREQSKTDDKEGAGVLHEGVRITESMSIERPVVEVYRLWRDFRRFPDFMKHIQSIELTGPNTSHWTAAGPFGSVEWDAEISEERENEMLAWRSLESSPLATAGSLHFHESPDGTTLEVQLSYQVPGGPLGAVVSNLVWSDASDIVTQDLRRFKEYAESNITEANQI